MVQRPSIRPCQGRDRRFESGRDRQGRRAQTGATTLDRSAVESEIRAASARTWAALDAHDPSPAESDYADDFYIVHHNGAVQNKREWVQMFRTATLHAEEEDVRFVHLDDVVLELLLFHGWVTPADGRAYDFRERATLVWRLKEGRWQLVAFHGTRLPS